MRKSAHEWGTRHLAFVVLREIAGVLSLRVRMTSVKKEKARDGLGLLFA
jgi:hypothetical protein